MKPFDWVVILLAGLFIALALTVGPGCATASAKTASVVTASVHITGPIGKDTVAAVRNGLATPGLTRLNVLIDSPGGEFNASGEIVARFKLFRASGGVVRCTVDSVAMSGAFWILEACSVRIGTRASMYMTHAPYAAVSGYMTIPILEALHDQLARDYMLMATDIAARLGITVQDFVARTLAEPWEMTANEALAAHAIDRVVQ